MQRSKVSVMATESVVLIRNEGTVRILTLNRPDRLNAFNDELYAAMTACLVAARADASCTSSC